jgi:hemoglobin-like flavoprotein
MKRISLSVKLPLLFIVSVLIIMLMVGFTVHHRFYNQMVREYTERFNIYGKAKKTTDNRNKDL